METLAEKEHAWGISLDERKLLSQLFRDMGMEERRAPQSDLHKPQQHGPSMSSGFVSEESW